MDATLLERRDENAEHAEITEHTENYQEIVPLFRGFRYFRVFRVFLTALSSILLLTAQDVQAQSNLLPDRLGADWRAVSPARVINGQRLSSLPDADVRKEYGLQRVISRAYTDGRIRASVEVFELNFISNAYGLFTFNRGQLPPSSREFYRNRYVVRVSKTAPDENFDQQIFEAMGPYLIGGEGQLPTLPLHLPEADKIPESEKYIVGPAAFTKLKIFSELKDVINFDVGAEVTTADYRGGGGQMSLIIVEYYTPQSASDGHAQIQSYFNTLPQIEKDRRILKRIGNYVLAIVNIQDMPAAQNIASQIKYQTKIYWAGRKFSDIPLEYRPPDPVAIEEATGTVRVLLRSFYTMGAVLLSSILLGLAAGCLLFYWKRYRRRKLGLDDLFSDAGGSIRLNLDDYLLSDNPQIKQIGEGEKAKL